MAEAAEAAEEDFKAPKRGLPLCLAGRQPMPCTSAMNVRRLKGRAVPGRSERLAPLVDFPMPEAAPRPPRGSKIFVRAGQPYAKELRLLQHVMEKAPVGDPEAICKAWRRSWLRCEAF